MINNTSEENKDIVATDADGDYEEWEHSISRKCSCHSCNNKAELFLEIVRSPVSGYYCSSCAIDIKFHGVGVEVDYTTDEEKPRISQQVDGESFRGALV